MAPANVNQVNNIRLETLICFLAIIVFWVRRTEAAPSHPQARPDPRFLEDKLFGTRLRLPPIKLDVTEC